MTASTYTPYGAFELKARYQPNLIKAMLLTITTVGVILLAALLIENLKGEPQILPDDKKEDRIIIITDIKQEPLIIRSRDMNEQFERSMEARGTIPKPIVDSLVADPDAMIASRIEKQYMVDATGFDGIPEGTNIIVVETEDVIPPATEFHPTDTPAEMIFSVKPIYPRLAKLSGLEGVVSVQAYVGIDGNVIKAQVGVSSGSDVLDEAAVEAAYKNKFKPAVFDGQPVAVWVTYQVRFTLD
ncbi:MAG: energy transducer TonB [Candidatus Zixiibacteriota bacterium]